MKEYRERQSKQRKGNPSTTATGCVALSSGEEVPLRDHFSVYFPSAATVAASHGGNNVSSSAPFIPEY